MKPLSLSLLHRWCVVTLAVIVVFSVLAPIAANAAPPPALVDDFSHATRNNYGVDRLVVDDKSVGSQSQATHRCEDGVLTVEGELVPGRGTFAFITVPLLLSPEGKPIDVSAYEGVRVRLRVKKGSLSIQVGSSEVTNFDYHASSPIARKPGDFQEVRVAFKDMKRAFSEQTALNPKSITSVNLVAFSLAKEAFAYEVDEIGFY